VNFSQLWAATHISTVNSAIVHSFVRKKFSNLNEIYTVSTVCSIVW